MKIHIVKRGDTLYQIAQKYRIDLETLKAANPQIADPNDLKIGSKIKIPSNPVHIAEPPAGQVAHKHIVKQGDTLWQLSKKWGMPLQALIQFNPHLKNPNVLLSGETVYIPKTGTETPHIGQFGQNLFGQELPGASNPGNPANPAHYDPAQVLGEEAPMANPNLEPNVMKEPSNIANPMKPKAAPWTVNSSNWDPQMTEAEKMKQQASDLFHQIPTPAVPVASPVQQHPSGAHAYTSQPYPYSIPADPAQSWDGGISELQPESYGAGEWPEPSGLWPAPGQGQQQSGGFPAWPAAPQQQGVPGMGGFGQQGFPGMMGGFPQQGGPGMMGGFPQQGGPGMMGGFPQQGVPGMMGGFPQQGFQGPTGSFPQPGWTMSPTTGSAWPSPYGGYGQGSPSLTSYSTPYLYPFGAPYSRPQEQGDCGCGGTASKLPYAMPQQTPHSVHTQASPDGKPATVKINHSEKPAAAGAKASGKNKQGRKNAAMHRKQTVKRGNQPWTNL